MNTIKKSTELAISMCKSGWRYLYGAKGERYTKTLVATLAARYPSVYTPSLKTEALRDAGKGYNAVDCSGFVCKVLGINNKGSSQLMTDAFKCYAVNKKNAKEGMALWRSGHIAYVGKDLKIYEAASTKSDMKVSDWDKRAKDFTKLLVVKGSALEKSMKEKAVKSVE